jgi:hypothetical protein
MERKVREGEVSKKVNERRRREGRRERGQK